MFKNSREDKNKKYNKIFSEMKRGVLYKDVAKEMMLEDMKSANIKLLAEVNSIAMIKYFRNKNHSDKK